MKKKRLWWWILGIATAPFILMLCLHLGLAIQRYFRFNINVPNVEAADWFMFAGSYLGGAMTLLGVIVTLKYERRLNQHQQRIQSIEKERERLFSIINRLDVFAPSSCYLDFTSVMSVKEWNKRPDFTDVRRRIVDSMRELNQSSRDLQLGTDMCAQSADCARCKHICRLPTVQAEFRNTYTYMNTYLFDTLKLLDTYIVDQCQNAAKDELIYLYRESIALCQSQGTVSQYDEKDIDDIQKLKKDLNPQNVELEKRLNEISAMNQKEMVCLINQVREYCALRIQNAERIHSSNK